MNHPLQPPQDLVKIHATDPETSAPSDEAPSAYRLDSGRECKMVEYAPGKWAALVPREEIPRYGIVKFVHVGKNHWRPCLLSWSRYVCLAKFFKDRGGYAPEDREAHPELKKIGLEMSYSSVVRLYKNGFIRGTMPTPHRVLIDLESLYQHMQAASDPDFWTEERKKMFREVVY